ncbi:MAG: tail fiber domain-containing protein [Rhodothermaceae bacterium]|nr:tail fiber domain-containing protein [Rhodothermaceae bacterium]
MRTFLACLFLVLLSPGSLLFAQIEVGTSGNVGIGVAPNSGYALNIDGDFKTGLYVITNNQSGYLAGTRTLSYDGTYNYGLVSYGFYGTNNYGIYTYSVKGSSTTNAYGIFAKVDENTSGKNSYAGYFTTVGSENGNNYAGFFNGDVHITGDLNGSPVSDAKFKEEITRLDGRSSLQRLMQLRPVSYRFRKSQEFEAMKLSEGLQYGFTAQEVEAVFPEFVSDHTHPGATNEEGEHIGEPIEYKAVSYMKFIPLLLTAVQEQQAEINALKRVLRENGIVVDR